MSFDRGWDRIRPAFPVVIAEPEHNVAVRLSFPPLTRRKKIGITQQQDPSVFELLYFGAVPRRQDTGRFIFIANHPRL